MAQPPGYVNQTHPTHVCKLTKAIYGLKQAPRAWYIELKTFLISYGFKGSISDPSLFIYQHTSYNIYLFVYVDDIIITGPSQPPIRFSLKDLDRLSYFLGVEVIPNTHGLFLNQTKYIHDLLPRYTMDDCKPVSTPMATHTPLLHSHGTSVPNPSDYRAIVGSLQYLSLTRPDVAFAVNKLAQYMQAPIDLNWSALKHILRYLRGTIHDGIQLHHNTPMNLHAFTDTD